MRQASNCTCTCRAEASPQLPPTSSWRLVAFEDKTRAERCTALRNLPHGNCPSPCAPPHASLPMTSGADTSSPVRRPHRRAQSIPRIGSPGTASARSAKPASRLRAVSGLLCMLTALITAAAFLASTQLQPLFALLDSSSPRRAAPLLPPPPQRAPLRLTSWVADTPERSCLVDVRNASRAPSRTAASRAEDARRARCCLRRLRGALPIGLTAADADALRAKGFSDHFIAVLPRVEGAGLSPGTYATCAVVSNAPSLRLREFGTDIAAEIDASDAVFRINTAPVAGFERWIGSRTTHRILNTHKGVRTSAVAREDYKHPDRTVIIRDALYGRKQTANLSESWNTRQLGNPYGMLEDYRRLRRDFGDANIYLNHPVFTELALRYMHMGLVGGADRSLSSGAQSVMMALILCDRVTSFEVASSDALSRKHKYYYDTGRAQPYSWWHPFAEENGLLRMLASSIRDGTSIFEYDMTDVANSC